MPGHFLPAYTGGNCSFITGTQHSFQIYNTRIEEVCV